MKFKKLGKKTIISGAMCLTLLGSAVPAFAVNNTESSYTYNFDKFNGSRYTPGRKKDDSSKSYMRCDSITKTYKFTASVVASIGGGEYKNVGSPGYDFVANTATRMTNYVMEKGYRAAAIKANSGLNIKDVSASGKWNPDTK